MGVIDSAGGMRESKLRKNMKRDVEMIERDQDHHTRN